MMAAKTGNRKLPCGLLIGLAAGIAGAQQAPISKDAPVWEVGPVAAPLPARRPAEMAPNAPRVKCQGDQLTVAADNSTLRSILTAVQACSGMQIDLPPVAEGRVYLQLGPGPVREVMDALLSSTDLDYVIEPASSAPDKVVKVLLLAREKQAAEPGGTAVAANMAMTPARRAWMASRNTGRAVAATSDAEHDQTPVEETGTQGQPETAAPGSGEPAAATTGSEPADVKGASSDAKVTVSEDKADAKSAQAGDAGVPSPVDSASAPALSTPATATSVTNDGNQDAGAKELQNKITDMQQLFEQRKKMANPGVAPNQN